MKEWTEIPKIELYSDGGAEPNPGKGGYGVILSHKGYRKEFSQGFKHTTNNRMELMGVIVGLEQLKTSSEVQVYTDSKYVVDGIEKGWAKSWKAKNWYRTKNEKAINSDLWERLLNLISKHKVKFNWIKGHVGHAENERCDYLAGMALKSNNLLDDTGFNTTADKHLTDSIETSVHWTSQTKIIIKKAGDLCRKCNTPVEKRIPKNKKLKKNQTYYFEYYLFCPKCEEMYLVEEAKRLVQNTNMFNQ